jgi:hypothetical protein
MCDTFASVGTNPNKKMRVRLTAMQKKMPANRIAIMQQVIAITITPLQRQLGYFPMSTKTQAPNSCFKKDMKKATNLLITQWIKHGVETEFCEWKCVRNTLQCYLKALYKNQDGITPDEDMLPLMRRAAINALHGTPILGPWDDLAL